MDLRDGRAITCHVIAAPRGCFHAVGYRATNPAAYWQGGLPAEPGMAALARTLIEQRGRLADADRQRFIDAGYSAEQILDAASTITNYAPA